MDVLMPQLGETVAEGKIIKWFKSVGDAVAPGENLCEIETDKVTVEVPAIAAGVLSAINADIGTVAPVGAVIAVVSDGKASSQPVIAPLAAAPKSGGHCSRRSSASRAGAGKSAASDRARPFSRGSDAAPEFRAGDARLRCDGHPPRPPPRRRCRHRPDPSRRLGTAWPHHRQGHRGGDQGTPCILPIADPSGNVRGTHRRLPSRPTAHGRTGRRRCVGQPRSGSPRRGQRSRNSISQPGWISTG